MPICKNKDNLFCMSPILSKAAEMTLERRCKQDKERADLPQGAY